jgi:hypothetical protein
MTILGDQRPILPDDLDCAWARHPHITVRETPGCSAAVNAWHPLLERVA